MSTYNELLVEVKLFLNKKLYEEKIISYEIFEKVISTETIILRNWGSIVKV